MHWVSGRMLGRGSRRRMRWCAVMLVSLLAASIASALAADVFYGVELRLGEWGPDGFRTGNLGLLETVRYMLDNQSFFRDIVKPGFVLFMTLASSGVLGAYLSRRFIDDGDRFDIADQGFSATAITMGYVTTIQGGHWTDIWENVRIRRYGFLAYVAIAIVSGWCGPPDWTIWDLVLWPCWLWSYWF